jgi:hypothetical protein
MIFSQIKISNSDFENVNYKVYHYRNEDSFRINVFFIEANNSDLLDKNWKTFSNMIAVNYQNSENLSDNEFERWNFYTIYISKDNITKELKNQIENDKFSSRKIVEDSFNKVFNDDEANNLIIKHITNSDLKEIVELTQEVTISEYLPQNQNIWDLLEQEEKVIGDRETQRKLIKDIAKL